MEFSESLGFGNSTFMNIEKDALHAILDKDDNLEVIDESPTQFSNNAEKSGKADTKFHNQSRYKTKFRRIKSDSLLKSEHTYKNSTFFKNDVTFSINERDDVSSFVSVSKIEAAFKDISEKGREAEDLDAPIFSEDVQEILNESKNTFVTEEGVKQENNIEVENELDESSFICPEYSQILERSLKCNLKQSFVAKNPEGANIVEEVAWQKSLSCMSPEQLKWTSQKESLVECEPEVEINKNKLKSISEWNLPEQILKEYKKKGILEMFDWQVECLRNKRVIFEHSNLVYSAPTSAGKTLVSEILLLKTLLERQKKVLVILPFVSVVREKMMYLQDLLTPSGYRVEGFFGGYTPPGGFENINVAICTIEKANSIVNKLLGESKLDEVGAIVVDEIHLISDSGRGYILELLLAKVIYMSQKYDFHIQIITMSATLANAELLKKWLQAELYITDFRPVSLKEMIKIGSKIYDKDMNFIRDVRDNLPEKDYPFPELQNDNDHVAQLCIETLLEGCSVVVFCPSKDWCENLSVQLAGVIHFLLKNNEPLGTILRNHIKRESVEEVKKQLKDIPTGLDKVLEKTVSFGCAFHHAGLTTEERDIIEARFKKGDLKVIVATSTLSSGVNLPARRVIIRSPLFAGKQMSSLTYKQMIGRAGRTGQDTLGESILICTQNNAHVGKDLISADMKPIRSCLEMDGSSHLKRALLEVISAGVVQYISDVEMFFNCTLLCTQQKCNIGEKGNVESASSESDIEEQKKCIDESLQFLVEYEFIRLQKNEETNESIYIATRLGMACLASSMPPTDGLLLFAELQKARRCFVLESELHAVYLVTPYSVCYQLQDLDWLLFLDIWERLSPSMKKVGELVGVKESFLVRAMRGQSKLDFKLIQIHKRFYTSLALQELVNETPINTVAAKYKCNRGMLQSLQQMASTFAGIVTAFCNSLKWSTLSLIVSQFKERLYFGIHHDLIDLMRLSDLTQKRARCLFDAGVKSLIDLANADVLQVEKILHNSLSFDLNRQHDNEDDFDAEKRKTVRNFFITGRTGISVNEAAKLLIDNARQFLQYEIGVDNINWSQKLNKSNISTEKDELHMSCEEDRAEKKMNETLENLRKLSLVQQQDEKSVIEEANVKLTATADKEKKKMNKTVQHFQKFSLDQQQEEKCTIEEPNVKLTASVENYQNAEITTTSERTTDPTSKNLLVNNTQCVTANPLNNIQCVTWNRIVGNEKKSDASQAVTGGNIVLSSMVSKPIDDHEKPSTSRDARKLLIEERRKQALVLRNKKKAQLEERKSTSVEGNARLEARSELYSEENKENVKTRNIDPVAQTRRKKETLEKNLGEPLEKKSNLHVNTKNQDSPRRETDSKIVFEINFPIDKERNSKKNSEMNSKFESENKESIEKKKGTSKMNSSFHNRNSTDERKTISNVCNVSKKEARPTCSKEISNFDDMFVDSFEVNSEINNILKDTEAPKEKHLDGSFEEVPASQHQEPNFEETNFRSPHASRFARLQRTQRLDSPNLQVIKQSPLKVVEENKKNLCDSESISLSDLSVENSLIKNPVLLNASHIMSCSKICDDSSNFNCLEIIDMCGNEKLFKECFKDLLKTKRFGFSIGLQQQSHKARPIIGSNLLINQAAAKDAEEKKAEKLFMINDAAYVEGIAFCTSSNIVYFMNMQRENTCKEISTEYKCQCLRMIFESNEFTLQIFDTKEQLKILNSMKLYPKKLMCIVEDPKIANWILQPDKNLHLQGMAQQFAPECSALTNLCGKGRGYYSCGLDYHGAILAKVRCSVEACVTVHILKGQMENLERIGNGQLLKFFQEVEMPLQISLTNMEIYGFAVSEEALRSLYAKMLDTMKQLENKIYELHGSRFNLGSSSAVARVLGLHKKAHSKVSTSKQILEKLDTPISQMIMTYRKLNATISKNIQPLLKCVQNNRIFGQSITLTSTGRISMMEPNLQNVAKDFSINLGAVDPILISCRSAFFSTDSKRYLLSSDFCQLEMRILAHLSQDASLLEVMNSERDIFRAIASRWNHMSEEMVSEQLRNGTKQICYGVIYGMGARSLAESLKCSEQEAKMVSEQFHTAYPGIRLYADKVIKFAKNNGYVETITGRRRYLENINSEELQLKRQAERQAINSTIQGSAADIAKSAILRMEKNIIKYRDKLGLDENSVRFVLHLHDELIFEVPAEKARKIAKILSVTMENCVKLSVPLKVKLKIGRSWGELKETKV